MQKIIFISGVPGTGKTTLAHKIAIKYKIDKVVSLDIIKLSIKMFVNDDYINTTTHEAYKIENLSVIDGFIKHCNIINSYFVDIIKKIKDNVLIVEGATITKEFINNFKEYECYHINLNVDDKEMLISRYKEKLKLRKSNWIENIDVIMEINEYLKNSFKNNINISECDVNESIFY